MVGVMAKRAVKSKDPRKPAIVAALKRSSGGTKVTNVVQTGEFQFSGDCMRKHGDKTHWVHLGTFTLWDWRPA